MQAQQIGGLKKVRVKEGQCGEFEAMFGEFQAKVRECERGTVYYDLFRSRSNPNEYVVLEKYKNQEAWDAHQQSAHGKVLFPQIRAILVELAVEYFDERSPGLLGNCNERECEAFLLKPIEQMPSGVKVIHGSHDGTFDVAGRKVSAVREALGRAFIIPTGAHAFVNGTQVEDDHILKNNDTLEFILMATVSERKVNCQRRNAGEK